MSRIALIIQGPLCSKGVPGEFVHLAKGTNLKKYSIAYDCRDNIKSIINDFGDLFQRIIISTWGNEVTEGESFPGAELITQPDPGTISYESDGKPNNKYRQFLGINFALDHLTNNGFDGYAIKIRTDNYVQLSKLVEYFENLPDNIRDEKIGVPFITPKRCYIQDFYFAARVDIFRSFCDAQIKYPEFTESVHNETLLKFAYHKYKDDINVSNPAYFPAYFKPFVFNETIQIGEYMGKNVFYEFPHDIFFSQIQRGTPLSDTFIKKFQTNKPVSQRISKIKFITCNLSQCSTVTNASKTFFNIVRNSVNLLTIVTIKKMFIWYGNLRRLLKIPS